MASGFGVFDSSTHYNVGSSGYGWLLNRVYVSQSVNRTTRKVTIDIHSYLTYYRNSGGSWSGAISHNHNAGNYFQINIQGYADGTHSGQQLGLSNSTTVTPGNYYNILVQGIGAYNIADWSRSATIDYNDNGDAITRTWTSNLFYNGGGVNMQVTGSFTTDSIEPLSKCHLYGPVNGRAREIGKLYGSVNGVAKKITKLYAGDENGIARLIYRG